jgi:hypothetical protein
VIVQFSLSGLGHRSPGCCSIAAAFSSNRARPASWAATGASQCSFSRRLQAISRSRLTAPSAPGRIRTCDPRLRRPCRPKRQQNDGRHESPANATFLRPRRRALRIAERSAARTFGPLLGHSGPRELGGLDAASPGAKWRRNVATTSCQARRYWSSSLIPGRSDAQCQAGPARRGRGHRGPRRSAWTTRKSTSQRPTPARFHSRCQHPSRADAGSHRRPGKAPGCDPGDSSVSRKAQLEAGVLARMDGGSDGIVPASRRGCRE